MLGAASENPVPTWGRYQKSWVRWLRTKGCIKITCVCPCVCMCVCVCNGRSTEAISPEITPSSMNCALFRVGTWWGSIYREGKVVHHQRGQGNNVTENVYFSIRLFCSHKLCKWCPNVIVFCTSSFCFVSPTPWKGLVPESDKGGDLEALRLGLVRFCACSLTCELWAMNRLCYPQQLRKRSRKVW